MKALTIAAAGALALVSHGVADADVMNYAANLKSSPAGAAHGQVTVVVDTDRRLMDYKVTYSGLSGPPVSAAFHDPTASAADMSVPIAAPIHGELHLTDRQIDDLNAGKWTFDLKTGAPAGADIEGTLQRTMF